MKISFKHSDNKLNCQIFLDEAYIGDVCLNVFKQRWYLEPDFRVPNNIALDIKNKPYDSSYKAGKKLVRLYNSWGPVTKVKDITFGVDLDEILSFLKLRR